ncbi:MAG: HupE/UreJ family protein [Helicobacteraceae bacterium]|nr:HupE/UreJ family protein [Candidatus Sulfurimonas ponti]
MLFIKHILLLSVLSISLYAHALKENYLQVDYNQTTDTLNINLEVETRLLQEKYTFMDDNKNEIVSHKEMRNHQTTLLKYVMKHIAFYSNSEQLPLEDSNVSIARGDNLQTYMQINKSFQGISLDDLELKYDMFFELEDTHKLLIHLSDNRGDFILSKDLQHYKFTSTPMTQWERLIVFIEEGVVHILDGLDHLLFILMLLIPIVALKGSYLQLFKIITVFALAHSITLFISGFGLYVPSVPLVESAIALSIFVVASLNFFKLYSHVNYKIVFVFGLMHGFGFANVLKVGQVSDTTSFLVALFGFNLGVEFGQIFMVLVYMLPLYFIRDNKYKEHIIKILTFITAAISVVWFLERVGLI